MREKEEGREWKGEEKNGGMCYRKRVGREE